jgi:hypothetical protein
LLFDRSF